MRSRDVDARRAAARLAATMARGVVAPAARDAGGWVPPPPDGVPGPRSGRAAPVPGRADRRTGHAGDLGADPGADPDHDPGADPAADVVAGLTAARGVVHRGARPGPRHRRDVVTPRPDDPDEAGGAGDPATAASPVPGDPGVAWGPPARPRWAVTAAAALALLVIGALLTLMWGVRTAAGAPGVPVPDRPASRGTAAPGADDAATGRTPGAGAADTPQGGAGGVAGADVPAAVAPVAGPSAPPAGTAGSPPSSGPDSGRAAARLPAGEVVVHVVGRVGRPGIARLPSGSRVSDALAAAGGAGADADLAQVNLARPLVDGEQVRVPRPGEELPAPLPGGPTAPAPGAASGTDTPGAAAGQVALDLNAATVADLDALPGLGPVLSGRVVAFRDQVGRFSSVDELGEVSGIGEVLLERLRPLVRV